MSGLDDHCAALAPTLFHYTDQRGLIGICENGELWASVAYYLNDSTEFYSGIELARVALTDKINANTNPSLLENLKLMRDCIGRITDMINVFVCCFCVDGDLLSQWRGYAGGSSGYAIGFDGEKLRSIAARGGFDLRQCIYDKTKQRQMMDELIDRHVQDPGTSDRDRGGNFIKPLSQLVCAFKNDGFKEEKEWRLISRLDHSSDEFPLKLAFRAGPSTIIPMAKVNIRETTPDNIVHLQIAHVTVGPTPHPKLARDAVFKVIRNCSTQGLSMSDSNIPFRAW